LAELGVQCPKCESYYLNQIRLEDIKLPEQFPYLIKTSHGLSGEGTYIIKNANDLNYCLGELGSPGSRVKTVYKDTKCYSING
jgi:carbamoylphosphate synthase large subunit